MDLTNMLSASLSGVLTGSGPTGLIVGMLAVVAYQWAKAKFPRLKGLPNLVKLPGDPSTVPAPAPAVPPAEPASTGRPILDSLLRIFGPRAEVILAQELHRSVNEAPPEPASTLPPK